MENFCINNNKRWKPFLIQMNLFGLLCVFLFSFAWTLWFTLNNTKGIMSNRCGKSLRFIHVVKETAAEKVWSMQDIKVDCYIRSTCNWCGTKDESAKGKNLYMNEWMYCAMESRENDMWATSSNRKAICNLAIQMNRKLNWLDWMLNSTKNA